MIEITCNDRLGKKVRVKCNYLENEADLEGFEEKWVSDDISPRLQPRFKLNPDDTIGDLKKLIAAQTGTRSDKIVLKKCARFCLCIKDTTESYENAFIGAPGMVCYNPLTVGNQQFKYTIFKDNITLEDYEIHDGMNLELYYQ